MELSLQWQIRLLDKTKKLLALDIVQRVIYALGLILWTFLMWDATTGYPFSKSSLGVTYIMVFLIPAILLSLQILMNNVVLWALIFALVTIDIAVSLFLVIQDAIVRSGNHVKAIDWTVSDVLFLLVVFAAYFVIDWVIYLIRPQRRST